MAHTFPVALGGDTTTRRLGESAFGPIGPQEAKRLGRVGGALFLAAAAFSLPAGLALDPRPEPEAYLLGLSGMLLGAIALVIPWNRLSPNWLHVLLVGGILEVALAVKIFSDDFAFYYVAVVAYAAYIIRDRRVLGYYFVAITVAILAPLAYDMEHIRAQAHNILVALPVFIIIGELVVYLRDVLERREQRYRAFALEAVSLAIRIRGSRVKAAGKPADGIDAMLDELASEAERELEPLNSRRIIDHLERGRADGRGTVTIKNARTRLG